MFNPTDVPVKGHLWNKSNSCFQERITMFRLLINIISLLFLDIIHFSVQVGGGKILHAIETVY